MLNIVSIASQSPATGANLTFDTNQISTNCYVTHTEGSSTITLKKAGYYFITFNATAAATASTATSPIQVQMNKNGVAVSGASAEALSESNTSEVNLSFSTIVKVPASCCIVNNSANITFTNTGIQATYSTPSVSIFYVK